MRRAVFGGEAEQRANGSAGLAARFELQHLAEQDEDGDDGGRFKVEADGAGGVAKRRGKRSGRDDGHEAVEIGRAGPHRDEREHVRAAMTDGGPSALEERPAGQKDDRCGKGKLQPAEHLRRKQSLQRVRGQEVRHHDSEQRQSERGGDPEAPGHGGQLRVGFVYERDCHWLEGHAADWAIAGAGPDDFRMHWACPLAGALRCGRGGCRRCGCGRRRGARRGILCRVSLELLQAGLSAEVEGLAAVVRGASGGLRIDFHSADRVKHGLLHLLRGSRRGGHLRTRCANSGGDATGRESLPALGEDQFGLVLASISRRFSQFCRASRKWRISYTAGFVHKRIVRQSKLIIVASRYNKKQWLPLRNFRRRLTIWCRSILRRAGLCPSRSG